MKKFLALLVLVGAILGGCKSGCSSKHNDDLQPDKDSLNIDIGERGDSISNIPVIQENPVQTKAEKDSVLTELTKEVLTIFKNKQYSKLDSLIHPEEGVRFSPYATILPEDNKFSRTAFKKLVTTNKNKKLNWGIYDGSGDLISLTPAEYFSRFVYDANFVKPGKFDINDFIKTSNSNNNLKNKYQGSDFTESYISGSKKNGGTDWKSVRLVFKEINGKYYLVGVVHDQWTI